MDKTEYQERLAELRAYMDDKDYKDALRIANEIDWKRVKSIRTLNLVADVYEANKRYDDAKRILEIALSRAQVGRHILGRLVEVCIKLGQINEAEDYFDQYMKVGANDNSHYVLQYKLFRAKGAPINAQIAILEEYRDLEYTEKWAYELATLYARAGETEKCVDACDDLILWFGEGKYVVRALELKMKYVPLTASQKQLYQQERPKYEVSEVHVDPIEPIKKEETPEEMKNRLSESFHEVFQGIRKKPEKTGEEAPVAKVDNTIPLSQLHISDLEPENGETTEIPSQEIADKILERPEKPEEKKEPKTKIPEEARVWTDIGINRKENREEDFDLDSLLKETAGTFSREISSGAFADSIDEGAGLVPEEEEPAASEEETAGGKKAESAKPEPLPEQKTAAQETVPAEEPAAVSEPAEPAEEPAAVSKPAEEPAPEPAAEAEEPAAEPAQPEEAAAKKEEPHKKRRFGFFGRGRAQNQEKQEEKTPLESSEEKQPEAEAAKPEAAEPVERSGTAGRKKSAQTPDAAAAEAEASGAAKPAGVRRTAAEVRPPEKAEETAAPSEEVSGETSVSGGSRSSAESEKSANEVLKAALNIKQEKAPTAGEILARASAVNMSMEAERAKKEGIISPADQTRPVSVRPQEKPAEKPVQPEEPKKPAVSAFRESIWKALEEDERKKQKGTAAQMHPTHDAARKPAADSWKRDQAPEMPESESNAGSPYSGAALAAEGAARPEQPKKVHYNEELEVPDPEPKEKDRLSHSRTLDLSKVGENTVPLSLDEIISRETPEERRIRFLSKDNQLRMNDTQRRIFTYFAKIPGMDNQILGAMSAVYQHLDERTSSHGNLAVMGAQGSGKSRLSRNLVAAMCEDLEMKAAKIARITGYQMNRKDPAKVVAKMAGGFLMIEECSEMNDETVRKLSTALDFRTDRMIMILEDEKAAMRAFLAKHPDFAKKIDRVISIPIFTNDELVTFARTYAEENKCKLDDMAVLALYTIIGNNQSYDEPMTIARVKGLVDGAITRSRGGSRHRKGRRNKGYTPDGLLILHEKDFETN